MRKFPSPKIHGPNHNLCIRSIDISLIKARLSNTEISLKQTSLSNADFPVRQTPL